MIVNDLDGIVLVPVDFVSNKEEDILKIQQNNREVVKEITEYISKSAGKNSKDR
ncbi:MAG: regulator of RNase E activity RraA [Rickettsiales bacterium]|jgi:hypothetical protein